MDFYHVILRSDVVYSCTSFHRVGKVCRFDGDKFTFLLDENPMLHDAAKNIYFSSINDVCENVSTSRSHGVYQTVYRTTQVSR
jgi:hypothetical protein